MIWIFLIFLLIQVIGYPIVGFKLFSSIFKKDKSKIKSNSIWLLSLFVFSGFVFEVLPGSKFFWWPIEAVESKNYTKNLTGISFILPEPIYEADSERHFNGDGSSFSIYNLAEDIKEQLVKPDSTFFMKYPQKGIRDDWEIKNWTKTPIVSNDLDAFHFASYAENQSEFKLDELINEDGNYYAFKYYKQSFSDGESHILNVDFYLISPKRNILIVINVNT
ncbi:MAG: hypothetical protein ABJH72_09690 [Reichenbachiella sp.]|uniref:hypothetical protein n=1 Tax=Reichenbachiella sp. TaxID=2184521 RepID=UPI003267F60D